MISPRYKGYITHITDADEAKSMDDRGLKRIKQSAVTPDLGTSSAVAKVETRLVVKEGATTN